MSIELVTREQEGMKTPTRKMSSAQENAIAKAVGGKLTPNSGATDFGGKGDVVTDMFLLEAKTKMAKSKSISLRKEWFDKLAQETSFSGKRYSALVFNFGPGEANHYVIDEDLFVVLQDYLMKSDEGA